MCFQLVIGRCYVCKLAIRDVSNSQLEARKARDVSNSQLEARKARDVSNYQLEAQKARNVSNYQLEARKARQPIIFLTFVLLKTTRLFHAFC